MSEGYYGAGSTYYINTKLTATGSADQNARTTTSPTAGSQAFYDTTLDKTVPMRRVIVQNFGANALTVKIVTRKQGATGMVETTGDPITLSAGKSIDTYGMLDNIVNVLATGTASDTFEIMQMPMDEAGG